MHSLGDFILKQLVNNFHLKTGTLTNRKNFESYNGLTPDKFISGSISDVFVKLANLSLYSKMNLLPGKGVKSGHCDPLHIRC